ncbi:hypothetical protein QWY85_10055 [Neolewinella lacunae]|uniref:Uncharacterized protein n=1 Tax=Neolewinella lacunae TaxID=1517758 RepID=A0A923PH11_9BACT|nr:hypothetical protein [Neolewinella lacunae]MBC6993915.1 hypothetical protein [Neolewinella lacunae]MDN3635003.1 hypothetical protein [Neolewinella lacunae]
MHYYQEGGFADYLPQVRVFYCGMGAEMLGSHPIQIPDKNGKGQRGKKHGPV